MYWKTKIKIELLRITAKVINRGGRRDRFKSDMK